MLLVLGLMLAGTQAFAQDTGAVEGRVLGPENQPLIGINITLNGTPYGAATDSAGRYRIDAVPAGRYTLVASGIGYEKKTKTVYLQAGRVQTVSFTLKKATERLEEVVVSGERERYTADRVSKSLRIRTPLLQAPQNIQVVTSAVLADQQIFNMKEGVVRNVSGASRVGHWGHYARIYMRGTRITAFRNGMNVSMPWGPLAEDMSMVERIEFVKGPAGFMMANGQPGGFYNVVTEKPTGRTRRAVTLSVGSFGLYRATADIEGAFDAKGDVLYRLNVMGQRERSHVDYAFTNRYSIAPVLTYRFDEGTTVTAEYTYQYAQYSTLGAGYQFSKKGYEDVPRSFTLAGPSLDPTRVDDHSAFLTFRHRISADWQLTAKLAYFDYTLRGSDVWPASLDSAGYLKRELFLWDAHNENTLGQFFVNGEVTTGSVEHHLLAGLDIGRKRYIADFSQSQILSGDEPFNIYHPEYGLPEEVLPEFDRSQSLRNRAGYKQTQRHTALYVQDEVHLWRDKVRVTLAGRYTDSRDNEVSEQVFTPRIGLSVSLAPQTSVYGLYDQAYVPQAGTDYEGNGFDPVTGNNIEAGLKTEWLDGRMHATLSVYQITKNNVLTADPEHPKFSVQLGQTRTRGVEIDVQGELLPGLNVIFNYAYTDSKITKDTNEEVVGNATPGFIRHITNAWLSYRFEGGPLKGFGLSLGYQWQLDRYSWYVFDGSEKPLPNYFRLDGGISWQNDRLRLALNVNNILDAYLYTGSAYQGYYYWISEPPRNFRLTVGYRF